MAKIRLTPGTTGIYYFYCPGCKTYHQVWTAKEPGGDNPIWGFNGDLEKPTFSPSVCVTLPTPQGDLICHSFIRDGKIQYLQDCYHSLAGKTVEMEDLTDGKESSTD